MGSKNLKAIVVRGDRATPIADPSRFREAVKKAVEELRKNLVTSEVYPKFGTTATVNMTSEAGIFPIRNWQEGYSKETITLLSDPLRERFNFKDLPCSPGCPV